MLQDAQQCLGHCFQMSAAVIRHQAHPSEDFVVGCFLGFVFLLLVCLLACDKVGVSLCISNWFETLSIAQADLKPAL